MIDWFATDMALPTAPIFQQAICRGVDGDVMFPERGMSVAVLREACRACPARSECLVLALRNGERHGVWGGLSGKTLTSLRVRGWVEHVGEQYFYDDRDHELVIDVVPSKYTPRQARAVLRDREAEHNEQRAPTPAFAPGPTPSEAEAVPAVDSGMDGRPLHERDETAA